jgi:hypothetical protein
MTNTQVTKPSQLTRGTGGNPIDINSHRVRIDDGRIIVYLSTLLDADLSAAKPETSSWGFPAQLALDLDRAEHLAREILAELGKSVKHLELKLRKSNEIIQAQHSQLERIQHIHNEGR